MHQACDHLPLLNEERIRIYQRARHAREARFDGKFFVGVKTTDIYCRPICPARLPKEENVEYFETAVGAALSGYRPCLRCRPESAPHSFAWLGTQTSVYRAIELIQAGALVDGGLEKLSERLGITSRYLRKLFKQHLGISPLQFASYYRCLFAKQLLHDTKLPMTEVAFAAGFSSVRRFNEVVKTQLKLTPSQIRRTNEVSDSSLVLRMDYRPPFDWQHQYQFLARRVIQGLEWADNGVYGRTFEYQGARGWFEVEHSSSANSLTIRIAIDDVSKITSIHQRLRKLFDLDAPIRLINSLLKPKLETVLVYNCGLRVPAIWHPFEAGVRAVLGQQVSVAAAKRLVQELVYALGTKTHGNRFLFPNPKQVAASELEFLKMPGARKQALRNLANHFIVNSDDHELDSWNDIKGIGPWTINYAKLRSGNNPDVWLEGDAGIKNALKLLPRQIEDVDVFRPWRSYLSMHLWNQLS